jgi:hypothetical protein
MRRADDGVAMSVSPVGKADWEDLGPADPEGAAAAAKRKRQLMRGGTVNPTEDSKYGDSPLIRAEAAYDEDRLMKSIAAHCDTLERRLDDCEQVIRNGERDGKTQAR